MLFYLGQDRSYLNDPVKSEEVFRVLCAGDSMTFGQGCVPTESLPYQLEGVLNSAAWEAQFEVINAGVSGYSIHDAWARYCCKYTSFQPDLVVFIVCDNDAELYNHREATDDLVRSLTYVEFSEECFNPKGEHFPYFRLLLRDMAAHVLGGGPPVVVAFYDIHGGKHRERIMPRVRDACTDAGVPFADLSQDFVGSAAATHNALLKVSVADAHPSAVAHGIAARRLARTLRELGLIPTDPAGVLLPEPELVRKCFACADRAVESTTNAPRPLARLRRTLIAKCDSRARLRLADLDLLSAVERRSAMSDIEGAWRRAVALAVWESYVANFATDIVQFNFGSSLFDMALCRLAKTLFVLENSLDDSSLPGVREFQKAPIGLPSSILSEPARNHASARLQAWRTKHIQAQEFALRTLDHQQPSEGSRLSRGEAALACRLRVLLRRVAPLWQTAEAIIDAAEGHFSRFELLASRAASDIRPEVARMVTRAVALLGQVLDHVEFCLTALRYDSLLLLSRTSDRPVETCLTSLQVQLTAPECRETLTKDEPWSLEVRVKSAAPCERVVADIHTIVRDGRARTYRFQLPFFVEAELCLGLQNAQAVDVGTVTLWNTEDLPITLSTADFSLENAGQVYRAPHVLVPC